MVADVFESIFALLPCGSTQSSLPVHLNMLQNLDGTNRVKLVTPLMNSLLLCFFLLNKLMTEACPHNPYSSTIMAASLMPVVMPVLALACDRHNMQCAKLP